MDDLISRQDLLDKISRLMQSPWFLDGYVGIKDIEGKRPEEIINRLKWEERKNTIIILRDFCIRNMPAVEAVPLDKLCELCEEIDTAVPDTAVPCVLCEKIMPEWCKQNNHSPLTWDKGWKCPTWKQLLTKWMEGLHAD